MNGAPLLIPISALVAALAERAESLARELLPGGARRGDEWCVPASASPLGCSISVHLRGDKAGVWGAWGAGLGGDALDLVAAVQCGDDKRRAVAWAREWLQLDPARKAADRPAFAPARQPNAEDKRRAAFRLWLAAQPLRRGDEAFDYLSGTRGIDFEALGGAPRALRFVRALSCTEAKRSFPALLGAVVSGAGRFLTVHRTWLERQSDGRVLKAPVAEPKKIYGPCKGGAIHLARGASGKPWKDAPTGDTLGLCEGIEDALTYAVAVPEHRVAAALNVGNLMSLVLPAAIGTIIIAADNDPPESPAAQTLRRAVARFMAEGREIRIARCPPGVKDLNALLLETA